MIAVWCKNHLQIFLRQQTALALRPCASLLSLKNLLLDPRWIQEYLETSVLSWKITFRLLTPFLLPSFTYSRWSQINGTQVTINHYF